MTRTAQPTGWKVQTLSPLSGRWVRGKSYVQRADAEADARSRQGRTRIRPVYLHHACNRHGELVWMAF